METNKIFDGTAIIRIILLQALILLTCFAASSAKDEAKPTKEKSEREMAIERLISQRDSVLTADFLDIALLGGSSYPRGNFKLLTRKRWTVSILGTFRPGPGCLVQTGGTIGWAGFGKRQSQTKVAGDSSAVATRISEYNFIFAGAGFQVSPGKLFRPTFLFMPGLYLVDHEASFKNGNGDEIAVSQDSQLRFGLRCGFGGAVYIHQKVGIGLFYSLDTMLRLHTPTGIDNNGKILIESKTQRYDALQMYVAFPVGI